MSSGHKHNLEHTQRYSRDKNKFCACCSAFSPGAKSLCNASFKNVFCCPENKNKKKILRWAALKAAKRLQYSLYIWHLAVVKQADRLHITSKLRRECDLLTDIFRPWRQFFPYLKLMATEKNLAAHFLNCATLLLTQENKSLQHSTHIGQKLGKGFTIA